MKGFKAGSILQFQDEPVNDIFFVTEGVAIACHYEQGGKESWLDCYGSGEFIGLESLHEAYRAQCQIIARTDISVLRFKTQRFQSLMNQHPALNQLILKHLIHQIKKFQESRMETHMLSKRGRVASEFRRLAEPSHSASPEYVVSPKPVISEMALRLGIARETVSRTVSELIKNRVIERGSGEFIVPDLGRLEAQMR